MAANGIFIAADNFGLCNGICFFGKYVLIKWVVDKTSYEKSSGKAPKAEQK